MLSEEDKALFILAGYPVPVRCSYGVVYRKTADALLRVELDHSKQCTHYGRRLVELQHAGDYCICHAMQTGIFNRGTPIFTCMGELCDDGMS